MGVGGQAEIALDQFLLPMVLASDAVLSDGELIGDPAEGALVALADEGGGCRGGPGADTRVDRGRAAPEGERCTLFSALRRRRPPAAVLLGEVHRSVG